MELYDDVFYVPTRTRLCPTSNCTNKLSKLNKGPYCFVCQKKRIRQVFEARSIGPISSRNGRGYLSASQAVRAVSATTMAEH